MKQLKTNPIVIFIVLIWVIEVINIVLGHSLSQFGIYPRRLSGLVGIPLSPLLHANLFHLISNTVPLIVLAGIVSLQGQQKLYQLTLWIVFVGGFSVWLFGRPSSHIGASGLVFGYFGYLIGCAWFCRDLKSILQAAVVGILYGGMIFGALPTVKQHISWEAHLFGMIAGFIGAKLFYHSNHSSEIEP